MSRLAHSFLAAFSITPSTRTIPKLRFFSILGSAALSKNLPPRPKPPPDSEIEESYLKGSGPGGQKINKTNSAVQLKHIPTGIVVKSQATRSRSQNRKLAREILAQRVDEFVHGHQSRSALVGAIKKKKADSAAKKSRRKYRQLEEEKANAETAATATAAAAAATATERSPTEIPERSSDSTNDASTDSSNNTAGGSSQSGCDSRQRNL
ncbi:hypothetical protein Trco_001197 [Trichoderma cornu-damae]|uniref:Prokaryotic-type class I peptide chain release factors domain-containing protein n=1 Tax=Trichoderma cornu-damae TaxID=654480 RepID=A0A9P8QYG6_9HYPO|nr:hypothetical protein Trco_001197 [Trichoderma cornu-damae]